jgi:hypothetical protein
MPRRTCTSAFVSRTTRTVISTPFAFSRRALRTLRRRSSLLRSRGSRSRSSSPLSPSRRRWSSSRRREEAPRVRRRPARARRRASRRPPGLVPRGPRRSGAEPPDLPPSRGGTARRAAWPRRWCGLRKLARPCHASRAARNQGSLRWRRRRARGFMRGRPSLGARGKPRSSPRPPPGAHRGLQALPRSAPERPSSSAGRSSASTSPSSPSASRSRARGRP